ncbi:hypothetical protein V6N13_036234 [Hibiscus sabdariffa]
MWSTRINSDCTRHKGRRPLSLKGRSPQFFFLALPPSSSACVLLLHATSFSETKRKISISSKLQYLSAA